MHCLGHLDFAAVVAGAPPVLVPRACAGAQFPGQGSQRLRVQGGAPGKACGATKSACMDDGASLEKAIPQEWVEQLPVFR